MQKNKEWKEEGGQEGKGDGRKKRMKVKNKKRKQKRNPFYKRIKLKTKNSKKP